jgi:hypothetical protein
MKVRIKRTGDVYLVLAITWPIDAPKFKGSKNQTQLSGYDGNGLFELRWDDCEILVDGLNDFIIVQEVKHDNYLTMRWRPISDVEFWTSVREFDRKALSKLKQMVESAPELMGEYSNVHDMFETRLSAANELRILVCQTKSLSIHHIADVLNLLNYDEVELAGETLVDAFSQAKFEIPAPLIFRLHQVMDSLGARRYFKDHLQLPETAET